MSGGHIALLILVIGLGVLVGGILMLHIGDLGPLGDLGVLTVVLGAFTVLVMGIIMLICGLGMRVDRTGCSNWGEAAEREVKFVHPTYWSWDCLVRTDEGWTSRDNVVKYDD